MPTGIYDRSVRVGLKHRKHKSTYKQTKRCSFCKKDKPRNEFRMYPSGLLCSRCLECTSEYERSRKRNKRTNRNPYPEKNHARDMVKTKIRQGLIMPEPCEICGEKGQCHHDDYSKPLEVRWLCMKHHGEQHRVYP